MSEQIKEVNTQTGEEIERNLTDEEIKANKLAAEKAAKRDAEIAELHAPKIAARQSILDRLGLTEDELKTILG